MRIPEAQLARAIGELHQEGKMGSADLVQAFIAFLRRKRLMRRSGKIARALDTYSESESDTFSVEVTSARPLSPDEAKRVSTEAATLLGKTSRKATLQFHTDPSVIGGIRLETADTRYDGTVGRSLRELRKSL